MRLQELKGYIPVIITRNTYEDLLDQIEQGEKGTSRENREKNEIKKSYFKLKDQFNKFECISNKEIDKLNQKIEELTKELSNKNQTLEYFIKEKETLSIKVVELEGYKKRVDGQKGGYTKEINKLKIIIEELENKNKVQAKKIQEFTKSKQHTIEEYKNNGLRKNMKNKRGN